MSAWKVGEEQIWPLEDKLSRPPDIGPELQAICNKLGFPDKGLVAEIRIDPTEAMVLYYRLNEDGRKYTEEDGHASTRWRRFKVST